MITEKENILTDDEVKKEEERFKELNSKKEEERNEEEKKELVEIKERYGQRMQKKIDKLTWERKVAEEKYGEANKKVDELATEIEKIKSEKKTTEVIPKKETIQVGDKVFYTDKTLSQMVKSGEITDDEAFHHQQERTEEVAADKAYQRIKRESKEASEVENRKADMASVLKEFPHFSDKHPDHNSEDPFYKLVNRMWRDGYYTNPKGLSEAVKLAKELTAKNNTHIDREKDFSLEENDVSLRRDKEKEITLSEAEKEFAIRIYCLGDIKNSKTGRQYTEQEALHKALEAKKAVSRK